MRGRKLFVTRAGAPGSRYERQLHHYGSGLNAIPALAQYRQQPDDLHLLRIGYKIRG